MIFIITIDDAEICTINNLLKENIDIPLVVGVPAGLLGKELENKNVAPLDLLKEAIEKLDLEIASHGYFHVVPEIEKSEYYKIFASRLLHHPDKIGYIIDSFNFITKENNIGKSLVDYDKDREIVLSKKLLTEKFGKDPITFIYPTGYMPPKICNIVKREYSFARTCEVGINSLNLNGNNKYLLKTISITNSINLEKLERYYNKIIAREKGANEEFIVIETYHQLINNKKIDSIYDVKLDHFINHYKKLKQLETIINFESLSKMY